jgi:hypothetical protein
LALEVLPVKEGIEVYTEDGEVAVVFYSVRREGGKLIVDSKALDTMRMDMIFTEREMLKCLKMALSWPVISFVLLFPYFYIKMKFVRNSNPPKSIS